jgi:uncharacterized protein (TIGR00255 family)
MIGSMTGFGRCERMEGNRKFTVELKSVNHRYLDMSIRMPKRFNVFEGDIRSLLKEYMERGKVDVFITFEDFSEEQFDLHYNWDMAAQYLTYIKQISEEFMIPGDITAGQLSRFPDIFTIREPEIDDDDLWKGLQLTLHGAAEQFVDSRVREGEHLKDDILKKLDAMSSYVATIEERSPQIITEYRSKLETKVADLLADSQIDEARIAAEVTMYADKICVDEEIVRLKSHIKSMRDTLSAGASCGRKLDFIAQEMNREANTIMSKTTDIEITNIGIDLKTDIEKVREQIQNLE